MVDRAVNSTVPLFRAFLLLFLLSVSGSTLVLAQPGKVRANGIQIAYESFGVKTDEAVILIQGTGATLLHYPVELCEQIASKGFYVIRFDNRDVGLSLHLDSLGQPDWAAIIPFIGTCDPAPLPYTLMDMAEDVLGLMDTLNIEKAHIAGVSMGGAIAQLCAIHFPHRVMSLTCMASSSGNPLRPQGEAEALEAMSVPPPETQDPDSLATYLINVYKALGGVDDNQVLRERALNHVINRRWDPAGVNRQSAAVLIGDYCDRRDQLKNIGIPTLVIHGDADPIVPLEAGREVAGTIPGAEFIVIKGMGHDISLRFVNEISRYIVSIAQESGN